MQPHWRQCALGILALLLVNLLGARIPLLIRDGIDELQVTFGFDQIAQYSLVVLVLASVMWILRMASRIFLFGVGRQVEFDLKQRIFQHLLTMEPSYFATNTIGELISRATSDVDNIRRLLGFAVLSIANTLFAYAFTVPVMLSLSVRLTVVALLVYPVMLVLVRLFSDRLRNQQLRVQESTSRLSELIQEDLSGISLIKIYAQEYNERQAFAELNDDLLDANLTLARTRNTLFPLLGGLASISLLLILATGAGAIADGFLSVGDFVAMVLYVERLVFPTALLGFTITAYQRGEVSIDRVEAILMSEPKIADAPTLQALPGEAIRGQLEARNLMFTYPDSREPALNGVSFTAYPGETVAIVGPIGAGKSTLIKAMMGLIPISSGYIRLFDKKLDTVRSKISYVPQRDSVDWDFPASALDFASMGRNGKLGLFKRIRKSDREVAEECLRKVDMYTFKDRQISQLSGGQQQRIFLARALAQQADLYFMDEPFQGIDAKSQQAMIEVLKDLRDQGKTIVIVHHHLASVLDFCDHVTLLNKTIVASGPGGETFTKENIRAAYEASDGAEAFLETAL